MADPGTLKRIDEPPGEETKGSRERSRPATGAHTGPRSGLALPPEAIRGPAGESRSDQTADDRGRWRSDRLTVDDLPGRAGGPSRVRDAVRGPRSRADGR
jgi:hypothetical protein